MHLLHPESPWNWQVSRVRGDRPGGTRKFGNLLDPNSEIRYLIENKRVFPAKGRLKYLIPSSITFFAYLIIGECREATYGPRSRIFLLSSVR